MSEGNSEMLNVEYYMKQFLPNLMDCRFRYFEIENSLSPSLLLTKQLSENRILSNLGKSIK